MAPFSANVASGIAAQNVLGLVLGGFNALQSTTFYQVGPSADFTLQIV
ncbi:MAG: hypothetical protein ABI443_12835 [Chthoniobacterales bacterium]